MSDAPAPRRSRARAPIAARELDPAGASATRRGRTPARRRRRPSSGERHQADYAILVIVVALTAIGILMVYSSSAIEGLHRDRRHALDRRAADRVGRCSGSSRWSR